MNIGLIAHDSKKRADGAVLYCILRCAQPPQCMCNRNDRKACSRGNRIDILRFLSGSQGGDQQIAARIACNELDLLLMFRDPITVKPNELNEANILRLCDVHNVPVATNIATAEALIHALERGDLDWRNIGNPSV